MTVPIMNTSQLDYEIELCDLIKKKTILQYDDSEIYLATWRHQIICVKQIPNNIHTQNELQILSKSIHPRICQFLGANIGKKYISILFEYMENGDLYQYITSSKANSLTKRDKLTLMVDITIGLHYLHERKPQIIIHRDLKPSNIMINKQGEAKISDFGISKLVDIYGKNKYTGHTVEKGTYIWMSPEVLKHENYNYKSDIYCLGLIFYFIWTGNVPFHESKMNTVQIVFAKFKNKIENMKVEVENFDELNKLINECISYIPDDRPDTNQIINYLNMCLTI
jgi:serine/threonine protein kinase